MFFLIIISTQHSQFPFQYSIFSILVLQFILLSNIFIIVFEDMTILIFQVIVPTIFLVFLNPILLINFVIFHVLFIQPINYVSLITTKIITITSKIITITIILIQIIITITITIIIFIHVTSHQTIGLFIYIG